MINAIEFLVDKVGVPATALSGLVVLYLVLQLVGELIEKFSKVAVPEFVKIRKFFQRKKRERAETAETLQEVKQLLGEVNNHYSDDNISKRNSWMTWVNDRAKVYDDSIVEIGKNLTNVTDALKANTKLTEEMFVQNSRDRIIDFATKVADEKVPVSREEFNRIFKVYSNYEEFLAKHGMTNGEVDIAHRIITESYEKHIRNHSFIEDVRGY